MQSLAKQDNHLILPYNITDVNNFVGIGNKLFEGKYI